MTTNKALDYAQGDWIVHCYHGIGQIEAIEHKKISDQEGTYFRIKMANSVLWMPVDQMNSEQIRPIVSKTQFQEAVEVLRRPPKGMASNLSVRQARIKRVTADNLPEETARLIRDLLARRREKKGLNEGERRALRELTQRFLQEWSLCVGLTMSQARRRLNRQLYWKRRAARQKQAETGRKDHGVPETTPFIEALAKRDSKWSDWLNKQLIKGT